VLVLGITASSRIEIGDTEIVVLNVRHNLADVRWHHRAGKDRRTLSRDKWRHFDAIRGDDGDRHLVRLKLSGQTYNHDCGRIVFDADEAVQITRLEADSGR